MSFWPGHRGKVERALETASRRVRDKMGPRKIEGVKTELEREIKLFKTKSRGEKVK